MAEITSTLSSSPTAAPLGTGVVRRKCASAIPVSPGAVTTYYFRRTDGSRGSATSADNIPTGAVVEHTATT